ncbi:MAG: hypothetical protein Kow0074_17530 [Candidatus Zixiibacteriota bacterium]
MGHGAGRCEASALVKALLRSQLSIDRDRLRGDSLLSQNPVKQGLVESADQWTLSSYNWYYGQRDVPFRSDDDVF